MDAVNALLRKAILGAADDPRVRRLVSKHGLRLGGSRFVAGETVAECVRVLRSLNDKGLYANTTCSGRASATSRRRARSPTSTWGSSTGSWTRSCARTSR